MKRVLAGVTGLLLLVTLAGCASAKNEDGTPYEAVPDTTSYGDALGGTGGILLLPFIAWMIAAAVTWEDRPGISRIFVACAIVNFIVIVALWIMAIWSGFAGN